jgi:D-cysteine desulfhydrase
MELNLPARQTLARLPTPLEPLRRIAEGTGLDLWVKRDDLTGSALSGNKVRKLEFLVAEALATGADTLITCGALTSNHARATAVAAARVGLRSHLFLRGEAPPLPDGNLLLDHFVGATVTFITPEQWSARDTLMASEADRIAERGGQAYVIPEGGSNALGSLGYTLAAQELLEQAATEGLTLRRVVHATGSGGTTAGLALGMAALGRSDVDVIGVAVCDDADYFNGVITRILDDVQDAGFASAKTRSAARWQILEGYQGKGYALTTPEEMADHARLAQSEGLIVDPVYSGKAFRALLGEARKGCYEDPGATVFLHTGGIYGLFSFAAAIPNRVRDSSPRGS